MNKEMIPLAVPDLRGREREYLLQCVDDNWVSSAGPHVTAFEAQLANLTGRHFAVATTNGTTALQLALAGLEIGAGDHVLIPDWTFAATANAVYHAGATPYFVDVERETWTLDPDLVDRVLGDAGQSIAAVICVHTLGHPARMDALMAVCRKYDVPLIEDASGAIGSTCNGAPVGSFGTAACFSFNGNKLVTAGGGGMIVTDDETLANRARHLSTQARVGNAYQHDAVGWNYRMTNVNAAIGLAQMERLEEMVACKRRIAAEYDAVFGGFEFLQLMPRAAWADTNFWLYSLLLPGTREAGELVEFLGARQIQARIFWESLSAQTPYADAPKCLSGVSTDISGRVVSLPCSTQLDATAQARVTAAVIDWINTQATRRNRSSGA
jgi:perosamine synthetase